MSDTDSQVDSSKAKADLNVGVRHDPLLESLIAIARYEHKACSHTSLVAGLPLVDGKLTPELLSRAAARAELHASVVSRELSSISELVLPAILLLNDNNAVVLLSLDKLQGVAKVFLPLAGTEQDIKIENLIKEYSGYAVFTKPQDKYEERAEHQEPAKEGHWFWSTISKSWRIYRDVLIASLLINVFALSNPLFVMNVYDRVVPNNAIETLWALAIGILCVFAFDYILKMLRIYFVEIAGKKSDVLLSTHIFEKVLGAKFDRHPASVGAFVSQLRDFESVRNFITSSTITAFVDLPFVLLFIVTVAYIGGDLVWVPLTFIPFILGFALISQRYLQRAVVNSFTASAQKSATLVESMTSLETLKTLNAEGKVLRKWEKAVALLSYWGLKSRVLSSGATSFAMFIQQISGVFVVIVGVYAISENELTMGGLIACVLLSGRILAPFAQVAGLLVQYQQSKLSLMSLENIVQQAQERPDGKPFTKRERINGKVEFSNVNFTYPGEDIKALEQVSFKIEAGEKIAIIGRLGSGKSTIHKLIAGLYQPDSGSILIDGIDIKQFDPADLRENLACVPQDVLLFYGTIKDNIAYKLTAVDDAEVIRVANMCGVSEFVNAHPHGFDRRISERGENLSGGQKQAIALARSFVHDPPIVMLDEPTSAMDSSTETKLIASLKKELTDKTLLLVTHKTTLLELVDRVLVMDKGKIVIDGKKEKVIEALKKGQVRVS